MNKKIVGIFVMALLIATAYSSLGIEENRSSRFNNSIDVIDQQQSDWNGGGMSGLGFNFNALGQSFNPSLNTITRVELILHRTGNPNGDAILSIRNELDGNDLISKNIPLASIPQDTPNADWVEFDFDDIYINPSESYYIVLNATGQLDMDNRISWGIMWNTNPYPYGRAYSKYEGNWNVTDHDDDFCFRTYWRDYAPDACEINGPTEGKAKEKTYYNFSTNDPEGHDVRYFIEWGDGDIIDWFGPYESGEIVTESHSWENKGDYKIRVIAKDIYGAESDWTELEVNMPKTKTINSPFITFLQNHPRLFPLLRQILGL